MYYLIRFAVALGCFFQMSMVCADPNLVKREDVKQFIQEMVKKHAFQSQQILSALDRAAFQPKIIESMERPYEKKNWDVYKNLFLTRERLEAGLQFWKENQIALEASERQFGVPPEMVVAIIGVETRYGKNQGTYRVLDSLTTLAFHYPKRADYFKRELEEYLLLCREQGVSPLSYLGSYAGAIGKPQFMPSSYRVYAVDSKGNGKKDLVNNDSDVIASVANYFHQHGWSKNGEVAQPAQVHRSHLRAIVTNTKTPNYEIHQLMQRGVRPTYALKNHPKKAGVIELTTDKGQEYWMAYPNFYVITRYNTSPQYALVVHLFSEQLRQQWQEQQAAQLKSLNHSHA